MSSSLVPPSDWFHGELVERLSASLDDPPNVREERAKAFHAFESLPNEQDPLYRKYSHLEGIDLRAVDPSRKGPSVALPTPAPSEVLVVHDASGTRISIAPELAGEGLQALALPDIWTAPGALPGIFACDLERLHKERFGAMNAALLNRGLFVAVPDQFSTPVRIREVSVLSEKEQALVVHRMLKTGTSTHLFHTEEVYTAGDLPGQRLYSSTTSLQVGGDSSAISLVSHAPQGAVVGFYDRYSEVGRNTAVSWLFAGLDGFRTTLRNHSRLNNPGGELSDYQVYLGDSAQSATSYIHVAHEADDTRGQSLSRGVFRDQSRAIIKGMMRIESHVRKIYSNLSEHAMLLSRQAKADTLPGLEILSAADVKATHSSSVAPLDTEKVFYLQSRGLEERTATRVIADGFLANVLLKTPIEGLEPSVSKVLDSRWQNQHLRWEGTSAYPSLTPTSAHWRAAADVRMDTKLR